MNEHDEQVLRIYTMDDDVDVLMSIAYMLRQHRHVEDILADGQRYVAVDIENTLTDDGYRMREQLIAEAWGLA